MVRHRLSPHDQKLTSRLCSNSSASWQPSCSSTVAGRLRSRTETCRIDSVRPSATVISSLSLCSSRIRIDADAERSRAVFAVPARREANTAWHDATESRRRRPHGRNAVHHGRRATKMAAQERSHRARVLSLVIDWSSHRSYASGEFFPYRGR